MARLDAAARAQVKLGHLATSVSQKCWSTGPKLQTKTVKLNFTPVSQPEHSRKDSIYISLIFGKETETVPD